MKTRQLLSLIIFSVLLFSCQKENTSGNKTVAAANYLNIAYASDPLQKMDIYLPAGRTSSATKVIVMIHGGAWSGGDKTELSPFVDTLKRRLPGYAIFNINYRLSAAPNNLFPTQENDVKAAMEFIYSKAAEYSISDKYALIGASAGGHLAMLQGYKNSGTKKPKAVVSFSGPSDMVDMYNNPAGGNPLLSLLLASVVGATPGQNLLLYTNSSPANFITSNAAPTLLLYGDTDPIVKYSQGELVKNKLQTAGVVNQYVLYPGTAHVDTWNSLIFFDSFNKIEAFLTAHVL
ncbi:MAG: alpha/beta hydrolase [Ferruginibacter sp.]|nr:alpha/beta hydrolase [Ferruginibacter sp.]